MAADARALSLWQPWASAVAEGVKTVETRGWQTSYRGPLLICSALRVLPRREFDVLPDEVRAFARDRLWPVTQDGVDRMPFGSVLAVVDLTNCLRVTDRSYGRARELVRSQPGLLRIVSPLDTAAHGWQIRHLTAEEPWGDYTPGRFGWILENLRALPNPIAVRGRQGLWSPDTDLLDAVREQVRF